MRQGVVPDTLVVPGASVKLLEAVAAEIMFLAIVIVPESSEQVIPDLPEKQTGSEARNGTR